MRSKLIVLTTLLLGTLLFLSACGPAGESAVPTVDTEAIAATVEARVRAELAAEATAAAPAPTAETNTAEIVDTVLAQVSAEMVEESAPVTTEGDSSLLALESSLIDVYQRANPAVVYVLVPPLGSGSGFLFSEEGYIVTNNHVVADGDEYEIVFADGQRQPATLVGADEDSDLAVLQVENVPEGVEPLPLADFETLQVGEVVVAIGNPFGEQGSMSLGIISALGRSLPSQRDIGLGSSYSLPEVIQTDAPINPGNSGGPLLNLDGEVVGVNSAIVSTTGTNSGVGYAIPVEAVRRIVPSLIETGEYVYPYMGARFDAEVSLEEQEIYGLTQTSGTYVVAVEPGSPANEAGLIGADPETGAGGDLVIAIDGQPVNDFDDMNSYLVFNTSPGDTVELTVLREGEPVILPLTLGARP